MSLLEDKYGNFLIIWPEQRIIGSETILQAYADAVENGDCAAGAHTAQEAAQALDSAGLYTFAEI